MINLLNFCYCLGEMRNNLHSLLMHKCMDIEHNILKTLNYQSHHKDALIIYLFIHYFFCAINKVPNTMLGTVTNSGDVEANSVRFLCSVR